MPRLLSPNLTMAECLEKIVSDGNLAARHPQFSNGEDAYFVGDSLWAESGELAEVYLTGAQRVFRCWRIMVDLKIAASRNWHLYQLTAADKRVLADCFDDPGDPARRRYKRRSA